MTPVPAPPPSSRLAAWLPLLGPWLVLPLLAVPERVWSPPMRLVLGHPVELAAGLAGLLLLLPRQPADLRALLGAGLLLAAWKAGSGAEAATVTLALAALLHLACLHRLSLELAASPVPALALGVLDLHWAFSAPLYPGILPEAVPLTGLGLLWSGTAGFQAWHPVLPLLPCLVLAWRHRRRLLSRRAWAG